jgi:hypothetical protein
MDGTEARIRRLQRAAYGADATDAERARAVAELAELAMRGAGGGEAQSQGRPEHPIGGSTSSEHADAAAEAAPEPPARTTPPRRRLVRWAVVAGGAGLLLGAVLGWSVGQRMPADSALPSAEAPSDDSNIGTPLEDTGLLPLFDRLPLADDSARVASVDDAIEPASVRLLATRVDGPAAYLARTTDGENVCLVLLLPAAPSRSECTVDGRLPVDGLSILYGAQGYGLAEALLDPTGTVSLGFVITF